MSNSIIIIYADERRLALKIANLRKLSFRNWIHVSKLEQFKGIEGRKIIIVTIPSVEIQFELNYLAKCRNCEIENLY